MPFLKLLILTNKDGGIYLKITKVFWYAVILCIAIVIWGSFFPDHLNKLTAVTTIFIYNQFGWFYMFVIIGMIILCIFFMFSRFGNIKLGKKDDEPEFSLTAWFAKIGRAHV